MVSCKRYRQKSCMLLTTGKTDIFINLKKQTRMKKLEKVSVSQLNALELINMGAEITANAADPANNAQTEDVAANRYLSEIASGKTEFEKATKNILADPFTKELEVADKKRDIAVSAYRRQLRVYEYDADPTKTEAFFRLDALWKRHADISSLNYKAQTSGIDNFLLDGEAEPYKTDTATLALVPFGENVRTANEGFKAIVAKQDAGKALQEHHDLKALRRTLEKSITTYSKYVLAMANAYPDRADFDKLLALLNVTRKKYGDLLARRRASKTKPEEPVA